MNCIWITTDSFRQDHVHCYRPQGPLDPAGRPLPVETPHLDRLAEESVVFDRMRAESLPTIPCRRARQVYPPDERNEAAKKRGRAQDWGETP